MHVRLDHLDDHRVHHLQGGRDDPGRDDARHGRGGVTQIREVGQQRRHRGWKGGQTHGDPRRDAHGAFAPDERPSQIQPIRLGIDATEQADRTVRQDDFDGQDVGAGDAVEQAVGTTGVVGQVAADGARLLAGRVRGEVQAEMGHGPGQVQVEDPGLDPGEALACVDLEDPVHLGRDDHDGRNVAGWRGPAGQTRPGTRGTKGRPWSRHTRTAAATSAVVVGKHTTAASPVIIEASRRYRPSSVGSARTRSAPTASLRSLMRAAVTSVAVVIDSQFGASCSGSGSPEPAGPA